jgi:hypothetical protein
MLSLQIPVEIVKTLLSFALVLDLSGDDAENFDLLQLAEAVETLSEKPLPDAI